uniref:C2 domain-containing protein n=1 Tax=Meloidogyne javanica TaxID=6303 RepID=A0A915N0H9_MELJA
MVPDFLIIMDCDLDAIKKAIGHESDDGDIEADEELMAELLALNGDNLQDFELVKRPKQPPKTAPKPKQQKQEFVIPSNILNLENDGVDMEVSEADMNDKDLLSELGGLVGTQSNNDVELNEESTSQSNITQNHASCQSLIDIKSEEEEGIAPKETESPLKMDTSSIKEKPSNPMSEESEQSTQNDNQPSSSLDSIARTLLTRRRKLYLERAKAAREANDKTVAVEAFKTVKLFTQALDAMDEGATLSEEDIQQIPSSPPPYKSALIKPEVKPIKESSAVKHSDKNTKNKAKTVVEPYMSDELKLVTSRQMQLKQAALTAKNQGDIDTAKELLALAMRMKPMVEAAECGLPIDVQQIPSLPSTSKALSTKISKRIVVDPETLKKCQTLERELLKQISLCTEKSSQFQSVGDSKNTLFYEALLQTCKKNLQSVQMAMLGNAEFPSFKIGWSASDLYLFVAYKFAFSIDSQVQQTGKTSVVKGTSSPEFPDVFHLNINRKNKFLRFCKRGSIKLEIFQKGGFFRSDKLFGHAEVPLQELEQNIFIRGQYKILEGKKKTNGLIFVDIQISKPIGISNSGGAVKRKWVKLDD